MDLTSRVVDFRRQYRQTFELIRDAGGMRTMVVAMGDRFPLFLMGLVVLQWMKLRAAVTTEAEALASVVRHRPDLLICSDRLESGSIVSCIRSACQDVPGMGVILILSQNPQGPGLRAAEQRSLEPLVDGMVLENDLSADEAPLAAAFIAVVRGQRYRSPTLRAQASAPAAAAQKPEDSGLTPLTPREEEVLGLMVRGLKDREIAEALGIGYETCRSYVKTVRRKLGGGSRGQTAARFWGS
jgi:DNA-binding NarL/FixJ family response regulator